MCSEFSLNAMPQVWFSDCMYLRIKQITMLLEEVMTGRDAQESIKCILTSAAHSACAHFSPLSWPFPHCPKYIPYIQFPIPGP